MDSYAYAGLSVFAVVAAFTLQARLRRRRGAQGPPALGAPSSAPRGAMAAPLDHVRMVNDPSRCLGRRRDDGVGGES